MFDEFSCVFQYIVNVLLIFTLFGLLGPAGAGCSLQGEDLQGENKWQHQQCLDTL